MSEKAQKQLAMLPWFPRDFMASTRGWSVTARGVYRELLDAQWDNGGLPDDPRELRAMIGASPGEWKSGWERCEQKFPLCQDGRRRNERLERHRSKAHELSVKRREFGSKGGQVTAAQKQAIAEAIAQANGVAKLNHPSPSPSPSPSLNTHESSHPRASAEKVEETIKNLKAAGLSPSEIARSLKPYGLTEDDVKRIGAAA